MTIRRGLSSFQARRERVIFEDEQDGNAILEPIIFEDGFLVVDKKNQLLQEFLSLHPQNGLKFEEVNLERDAKDDVEYLNMEVDALVEARSLSIEQVENLCRVLFSMNTDKYTTAELKRDMLVYARNNPADFLNALNAKSMITGKFTWLNHQIHTYWTFIINLLFNLNFF